MMRKLERVVTDDGSVTFFDKDLGEHYHSTAGAMAEARSKHVIPARIPKRYQENGGMIRILDFAFGLGYNTAAAIESLMNSGDELPDIIITALENDPEIINRINEIDADFTGWEILQKFAEKFSSYSRTIKPFIFKSDNIEIRLFLQDARETIPSLKKNYYDAVFFDPFSSGRVPGLWDKSIFSGLNKVLKKGGCLTTYSCARHFRDKLETTGFSWFDVPPGIERRGPSTIALKK